MAYSRLVSTISYNTESFLRKKLDMLIKSGVVIEWFYIKHQKEDAKLKDHFHVLLNLNRRIDALTLKEYFKEIVPDNDKPLSVIDIQTSKMDDWILYCEHFEPYLRSKGEFKEYHYSYDDFKVSDTMAFEHYYNHAHHASKWHQDFIRLKALEVGISPCEMVTQGLVPLNIFSHVKAFNDDQVKHGYKFRTSRIDDLNEEIIRLEELRKKLTEDLNNGILLNNKGD